MYLILHYAMLAVQTFNYFQTLAGFHMERHKAYLKNRCRFCEEVKAGWKCNLSSLKYVLEEAFGDYDTENDNEETDSSVVCRKCYKIAKKWEKEYQAFQLFKRKNPSSSKEFSTNAQLPDSILSPVIHIDHFLARMELWTFHQIPLGHHQQVDRLLRHHLQHQGGSLSDLELRKSVHLQSLAS